jgi:hypothetical protein
MPNSNVLQVALGAYSLPLRLLTTPMETIFLLRALTTFFDLHHACHLGI